MPPQVHKDRNAPFIVDDESVVTDSVLGTCRDDHKSGLLTETECGGVLLSMSGYDAKTQPQDYSYGYSPATRPNQAQGYAAYGQPGYPLQYTGTPTQVPSGLPNAAELPLLTPNQYASHDTSYTHQQPSYPAYIAAGSRHLPEVVSFSPIQGPAGRKLFVSLNSVDDLEAPPASTFTIMFGTRRCDTVLTKFPQQNQSSNYALSVDVPPFHATGSSSTQVPLYLEMSDGTSAMAMPVQFGSFTYTDATAYQLSSPSDSHFSRKRKLSPSSSELSRSPVKKPSLQQLGIQVGGSINASNASPPSATSSTLYGGGQGQEGYRTFGGTQQYQQSAQGTQSNPAYGESPHVGSAQLNTQQPQTPAYSPYPSYVTTAERAPQSAPASSSLTSRTPILPSPGANPPLVRTTALQSSPTLQTPGSGGSSFNPYAMYPPNTKAVLKLEGELGSMAENWTSDEWENKRRLVRFQRSQNGSTISASFAPVTPEEHARAPGSIYVNCIWWEEKGQCYVTSVDTIQLLEALVAVRFTVEEKNRIRRNLEGFRPLTVAKARPECEEFFKLIMGFPSPKPRNIEKDVKVFPWRILATALKKIIGKYSASYASTASSIPSSAPPSGSAVMSSGGVAHQRPTISPGSSSSSAASMAYAPTSTMSSHIDGSAGLVTSAGAQDLRPVYSASTGLGPSISWHQPSTSYSSDLSGSGRNSWDFSQYLEPASGPNMPQQYQRIPSISQSLGFTSQYMPAPDYRDYQARTSEA